MFSASKIVALAGAEALAMVRASVNDQERVLAIRYHGIAAQFALAALLQREGDFAGAHTTVIMAIRALAHYREGFRYKEDFAVLRKRNGAFAVDNRGERKQTGTWRNEYG